MMLIATIAGHAIARRGLAFTWTAGLAVDGDGSPRCYHPDNHGGLDDLANAGSPGAWWGIACDDHGEPYVQTATDPAPGFYVSQTALGDHRWPERDPRRYVDAGRVAYLAIPPELTALGVHLGDVALVEFRGEWAPAIVADIGPRGKLGEGSIALARALGIPDSPRHGGVGAGVRVTVWPASATRVPWPRSMEGITAEAVKLRGMLAA